MGHLSKAQNGRKVFHRGKFTDQEGAAGIGFGACRLVFRRYAFDGIGDSAINQFKPVVGALCIGARSEAEFLERAVKQITGIITGERTAGCIRPL